MGEVVSSNLTHGTNKRNAMAEVIVADSDLIEFLWDCEPYRGKLTDGTPFLVEPGDSLWGEETDEGLKLHFHTKGIVLH